MTTSVEAAEPRALSVEVTEDELGVSLTDGRRLYVPLVWYPRLLRATSEQRQNWEFIGDGEGIHWPDVDEDLSVAGMLAGIPSQETRFRAEVEAARAAISRRHS